MDEIYKVTGKKIKALLNAEVDRRQKFLEDTEKAVLKDLKKLGVKGAVGCSFRRNGWNNGYRLACIIFSSKGLGQKDFDKYWKKSKSPATRNGKQVDGYIAKVSTNIGREIQDIIRLHAKEECFFQSEEIAKAVGFSPDKKEDFQPGMIVINNFVPGWFTDPETKDKTFFFTPYKGYKTVAGVKEMYPSEYNRLMGDD